MSNNQKYRNLFATLKIFSEKYDLDYEQRLDCLQGSFETGYIDEDILKEEVLIAVEDKGFDWISFAKQCELVEFFPEEDCRNEDIITYLKTLLWRPLFPSEFPEELVQAMTQEIRKIVSHFESTDGWISCNKIKVLLEKKMQFEEYLFYLALWSPYFIRKPSARTHLLAGYFKNR